MDEIQISLHGKMLALDDAVKSVHCLIKLVIYQNVIILVHALRFLCCSGKTLVDHFCSLRASSHKTLS